VATPCVFEVFLLETLLDNERFFWWPKNGRRIPIGSCLFAVLKRSSCRGELISSCTGVISPVLEHVGALASRVIANKLLVTEDGDLKSAKKIITGSSLQTLAMRGLANGFVFQAGILTVNRTG